MNCSTPFFLRLPVTSTNSQFPSESPLIFALSDGNYCILFFFILNYITFSCIVLFHAPLLLPHIVLITLTYCSLVLALSYWNIVKL